MYSYTIFIMLLPLLSFLILGLAGMKMQHKVAGLIGTCSLGLVTILSYMTAFQYFGADRVNGIYQTIVPYNFTWLPLGNLHFDLGIEQYVTERSTTGYVLLAKPTCLRSVWRKISGNI